MTNNIQTVLKSHDELIIKPCITKEQLCEFGKKFYGLVVDPDIEVMEKESYEDRCFIVHGRLATRGNNLDNVYCEYDKFVLKLYNSRFTTYYHYYEDRYGKLTNFKNQHLYDNIQFPQCLQLITEDSYLGKCEIPLQQNTVFKGCSREDLLNHSELGLDSAGNLSAVHIIKLSLFIPGSIVDYDDMSDKLLHKWGTATGKLNLILKELSWVPYESHNIWNMIRCADKIRDPYIKSIKGNHRKAILEKIVNDFETDVLPNMQKELTMEYIHSDLNEHNILCNDQHDIVGILDFDDCFYSYRVVDIATSLMYISTGSEVCDILGNVKKLFKGYCSVIDLNQTEIESLYVLILTRYVWSISIGTYQFSLDPDNNYLLFTVNKAWERLDALVSIGKKAFLKEITS